MRAGTFYGTFQGGTSPSLCLIILLHGVPGVGKTSTAECVAASTPRPLFPITCGDIGASSAQEVEESLEGYFELARKWGCMLLLDKADVFLSERKRGVIAQNSLVSGKTVTTPSNSCHGFH
jgi:SpoVK/Ycf46/Vps4 family AAA+-type ATPase